MKTTVVETKASSLTSVRDTPMGTVGYIRKSMLPSYNGKLVLKTFAGLVSLQKLEGHREFFGATWDNQVSFYIEALPAGSIITLEVE